MLTGNRNRARAVRTVVTAAMLAAAAGASAQIKYTLVAESGGVAPGAGGATFSAVDLGIGFPYHNNAATLGFRATLAWGGGVGDANDGVVYGGQAGALSLVAREGAAAPGTPAGVVFDLISNSVQLGGGGHVAFTSWLTGPGVTFGIDDTGLWAGTPGALELAARTGSWAPGTGSVFASLGIPAVNGSGQLAFGGNLDVPVFGSGFWFGAIGHMTIIARDGDPAPEFGSGINYGSFDMFSSTTPNILLNSAGQVLYSGTVVGPTIGGANNWVMWGGTPGSVHIIVREGSTISGAMSGPTWLGAEQAVLTDVGAVAFRGTIAGSGISAANDVGVWHGYILGVLTEVAREGDPAGVPGLPLGTVWSNLSGLGGFGVPKMNDTNQVAFRAQVSGASITAPNDTGIWAHNDIGALVMVAREGNPATGAAGAVFTAFDAQSPVINNLGQVAFFATLNTGAQGIWATDPYGAMHLAMATFAPVTVAPGDTRTITAIRPIAGRGIQDGTSTTFNDQGVLFIRADYSGGTGLFLADVNDQCRPVFTTQPDAQSIRPGESASFTVATSGPGSHTHQWRRDGVPLVNGSYPGTGTIMGADTATLEVLGAQPSDSGSYDCVVTNRCGSVTSTAVALTVRCPSDYNNDGFVDGIDYDDFNNDFESTDPVEQMNADYNGDGFVDGMDYDGFNNDFEGGC